MIEIIVVALMAMGLAYMDYIVSLGDDTMTVSKYCPRCNRCDGPATGIVLDLDSFDDELLCEVHLNVTTVGYSFTQIARFSESGVLTFTRSQYTKYVHPSKLGLREG